MRPAVSVILPVRDGGRFLAEAVDSVLGQDFTDLELLVVDDGSSDGAVGALAGHDPRLRRLDNAGNGLIDALNTGLRYAGGRHIARMDADDIALPHRLRVQLDYLRAHPNVAIAGGRVEGLFEGDPGAGARRYLAWVNGLTEPEAIHRERFIECPLPHPTWLMDAGVMAELGGYRDAGWAEDYDLLLRAAGRGLRCGKPAPVVLRWRDHPDRASRRHPRYALDRFVAARAHFLAAGPLADRAAVIWGAGPGGRDLHDALVAEGVTVAGFLEVHPRRIGGTKRERPVWHFDEARKRARESVIVVAVGVPSARAEIRARLAADGLAEGEDWWFAA